MATDSFDKAFEFSNGHNEYAIVFAQLIYSGKRDIGVTTWKCI